MKFTLIYDGDLPAGDKKRAEYAAKIRNALHPQLLDLWENHPLMRQLAHEGRVFKNRTVMNKYPLPELPKDYLDGPPRPVSDSQIDLTLPIDVQGIGSFRPIVREDLYLACTIDLTFLRHEEPRSLFDHGGDLDNRIKCFFDGLKIPKDDKGEDPIAQPLCVLLDNDKWITDFSVRSGWLLGKQNKGRHDVRIQADVTIKVLRVFPGNLGLVGG